jgi:ribose transport system substrate-binding protein
MPQSDCFPPTDSSRRGFLKSVAGTGLGLGALTAGCTAQQPAAAGEGKPLRAMFSNGGLRTTWCSLGHDTVLLWGKMLGVEIVWVDGQLNAEKQRQGIDLKANEDWDFCAFQTQQTGSLEDPIKKLSARGIPVLSMDTLPVERPRLREIGVWTHVAADHQQMAEASTRHLMDKIGGKGKVIHIGGHSAHSGAQDRKRGFEKVVAQFPKVEVTGGGCRWCEWKPELAASTFRTLLQQSKEQIAGAFFHNDDMALASIPALKGTPHEGMVVAAVDAQKQGLTGVREGLLACTATNPGCQIHQLALVIGQFIARNGEKIEDLPIEITLPTILVSKEAGNLDAILYLSNPTHCVM